MSVLREIGKVAVFWLALLGLVHVIENAAAAGADAAAPVIIRHINTTSGCAV